MARGALCPATPSSSWRRNEPRKHALGKRNGEEEEEEEEESLFKADAVRWSIVIERDLSFEDSD